MRRKNMRVKKAFNEIEMTHETVAGHFLKHPSALQSEYTYCMDKYAWYLGRAIVFHKTCHWLAEPDVLKKK